VVRLSMRLVLTLPQGGCLDVSVVVATTTTFGGDFSLFRLDSPQLLLSLSCLMSHEIHFDWKGFPTLFTLPRPQFGIMNQMVMSLESRSIGTILFTNFTEGGIGGEFPWLTIGMFLFMSE